MILNRTRKIRFAMLNQLLLKGLLSDMSLCGHQSQPKRCPISTEYEFLHMRLFMKTLAMP